MGGGGTRALVTVLGMEGGGAGRGRKIVKLLCVV